MIYIFIIIEFHFIESTNSLSIFPHFCNCCRHLIIFVQINITVWLLDHMNGISISFFSLESFFVYCIAFSNEFFHYRIPFGLLFWVLWSYWVYPGFALNGLSLWSYTRVDESVLLLTLSVRSSDQGSIASCVEHQLDTHYYNIEHL